MDITFETLRSLVISAVLAGRSSDPGTVEQCANRLLADLGFEPVEREPVEMRYEATFRIPPPPGPGFSVET